MFQKELQHMEAKGATPDLIMKKFVFDLDMYLMSRESYFRFMAHTDYMIDKLMEAKLENGTDKASDFNMVEIQKTEKAKELSSIFLP